MTAHLKDLVTLLLENRPDSPLEFATDYFRNVVHGSTAVVRAYRHVRLAHHKSPAFNDNLAAAYGFLEGDGSQVSLGLGGSSFMKLVGMLCHDFPDELSGPVQRHLARRPDDIVGFPEFASGARMCLFLEELLEESDAMYRHLTQRTSNHGRDLAHGRDGGSAVAVALPWQAPAREFLAEMDKLAEAPDYFEAVRADLEAAHAGGDQATIVFKVPSKSNPA